MTDTTSRDVLDLPRPNANRARAAMLFALLLIASAILGAVIDRTLLQRRHSIIGDTGFHPLSTMLRTPTESERREIRSEMSRELGLDAKQDSAIAVIMRRNAGQFQALRDEMRPRVEALVLQVRQQVDQVLTADQRERFHQLQARDGLPSSENRVP